MYRNTRYLRDELTSIMNDVRLTDLNADELLSLIAVLAPARTRVLEYQPSNVVRSRLHRC